MSNFCRSAYNSQYYARNRDRILARRESQNLQTSIQTHEGPIQRSLFEISNFESEISNKPTPFSNFFQTFKFEFNMSYLLILLIISNTYFLLCEAVEFYRVNQSSLETSVLAAVLVEFLLLAFSMVSTSKWAWKIAVKTMLVLLFAYSSWSFCSNILGKGYGNLEQLALLDKQISRIESRIEERNQLIGENLKLGRITIARNLTLDKDRLSTELFHLEKEKSLKLEVTPEAQRVNTWSLVVLRILLQLSNILMIHLLGTSKLKSEKQGARRSSKNEVRKTPEILGS